MLLVNRNCLQPDIHHRATLINRTPTNKRLHGHQISQDQSNVMSRLAAKAFPTGTLDSRLIHCLAKLGASIENRSVKFDLWVLHKPLHRVFACFLSENQFHHHGWPCKPSKIGPSVTGEHDYPVRCGDGVRSVD